jgi:hypothetical protein
VRIRNKLAMPQQKEVSSGYLKSVAISHRDAARVLRLLPRKEYADEAIACYIE